MSTTTDINLRKVLGYIEKAKRLFHGNRPAASSWEFFSKYGAYSAVPRLKPGVYVSTRKGFGDFEKVAIKGGTNPLSVHNCVRKRTASRTSAKDEDSFTRSLVPNHRSTFSPVSGFREPD